MVLGKKADLGSKRHSQDPFTDEKTRMVILLIRKRNTSFPSWKAPFVVLFVNEHSKRQTLGTKFLMNFELLSSVFDLQFAQKDKKLTLIEKIK